MKRFFLICMVLHPFLLAGSGMGGAAAPRAADQERTNPVTAAELEKIQVRVRALQERADTLGQEGKHAEALVCARELVAISERFPKSLKFREEMLDLLHFLLMKNGAFHEALETAFALERLSPSLSARPSPWNCLKTAEACLGLKEKARALDWIEKAVYERGFIRLDVLQAEMYAPLWSEPRFVKARAAMEKKIGIGRPARDFSVPLLDGSVFSLSGCRGRVVLVDFWDVKCPPCRKEMPNLKRLHSDYAARGLVIVGISLDTDKALLQGYLKEICPEWRMACSFLGWNDATARLYSINATPSSWLIDRQGVLRFVNLRGEKLGAAVRSLL